MPDIFQTEMCIFQVEMPDMFQTEKFVTVNSGVPLGFYL